MILIVNNPQLPHPGLEDVGVAEGAVELQLVLVNAGRGQGLPIIIILGTISLELYHSNTERFFPIFLILILFWVQTSSYYPSKYGATIR